MLNAYPGCPTPPSVYYKGNTLIASLGPTSLPTNKEEFGERRLPSFAKRLKEIEQNLHIK